jgi:DNA-binding NarL/FixJ family response regulator
MRKRLLIADDHWLMMEGLSRLLAEEYDIVGAVGDGRSLIHEARRLTPDIIVLDVAMPELNGIEAARQLVPLLPETKLIFVTQQLEKDYVRAAFQAGARAYVAKQSASTELLTAIRMALQGRFYVTPLVSLNGLGSVRDSRQNPADLIGGQLTPRQREVVQLVAEGKTMKEISAALNISVKTVEFHKTTLMNELGLRTTADLIRYALAQGIVSS